MVDLDGTLTDNFEGISRSILHALDRLGARAPGAGALRSCVGRRFARRFRACSATDDPVRIELAIGHYRERYAQTGWRENVLYDGIPTTVAELARTGTTLVLCTSKPQPYAERIVAHFGLAPHFAPSMARTSKATSTTRRCSSPGCSSAKGSTREGAR